MENGQQNAKPKIWSKKWLLCLFLTKNRLFWVQPNDLKPAQPSTRKTCSCKHFLVHSVQQNLEPKCPRRHIKFLRTEQNPTRHGFVRRNKWICFATQKCAQQTINPSKTVVNCQTHTRENTTMHKNPQPLDWATYNGNPSPTNQHKIWTLTTTSVSQKMHAHPQNFTAWVIWRVLPAEDATLLSPGCKRICLTVKSKRTLQKNQTREITASRKTRHVTKEKWLFDIKAKQTATLPASMRFHASASSFLWNSPAQKSNIDAIVSSIRTEWDEHLCWCCHAKFCRSDFHFMISDSLLNWTGDNQTEPYTTQAETTKQRLQNSQAPSNHLSSLWHVESFLLALALGLGLVRVQNK